MVDVLNAVPGPRDHKVSGEGIVEAVSKGGEGKQALLDSTNAALADGVFGVPSCIVGKRLFWGQDRLHQVRRFERGTEAVILVICHR